MYNINMLFYNKNLTMQTANRTYNRINMIMRLKCEGRVYIIDYWCWCQSFWNPKLSKVWEQSPATHTASLKNIEYRKIDPNPNTMFLFGEIEGPVSRTI